MPTVGHSSSPVKPRGFHRPPSGGGTRVAQSENTLRGDRLQTGFQFGWPLPVTPHCHLTPMPPGGSLVSSPVPGGRVGEDPDPPPHVRLVDVELARPVWFRSARHVDRT
jgi:hypothetical protein